MIIDPTATYTGTAALLAAIWMVVKYKPWLANGQVNGHKRWGDLDPADSEARIRKIITDAIDDKFELVAIKREEEMYRTVRETVNQVFATRTEELRRMLREELRTFYGLKGSARHWNEE